MATYSGNNDYLSIDGVDLSAYWREAEITPSIETADVTAGSGSTHRERNEGLKDHTFNFTIVYDSADLQTILPVIKPGTHTVIYGPEGNAAGKPKHQQSFIFTEVPTGGNYEKSDARVFSISAEAAAAPTYDMYAGAVF